MTSAFVVVADQPLEQPQQTVEDAPYPLPPQRPLDPDARDWYEALGPSQPAAKVVGPAVAGKGKSSHQVEATPVADPSPNVDAETPGSTSTAGCGEAAGETSMEVECGAAGNISTAEEEALLALDSA